jgi:hypothetical protein
MKVNMGSIDRILRITIAVILTVFILVGMFSGVTSAILGIIALVLLVTGIFSRCPMYYLLGISTCKCAAAGEKTENKAGDSKEESGS